MARKSGGRPRIEEKGLKRSQVLRASATQAERLLIESCASNAGLSLSAWLIEAALAAASRQTDDAQLWQLLQEIRRQSGDAATDDLEVRLKDAAFDDLGPLKTALREMKAEMAREVEERMGGYSSKQLERMGPMPDRAPGEDSCEAG